MNDSLCSRTATLVAALETMPESLANPATNTSLLCQVRGADPLAWRRLVALYDPLVRRWAVRCGLSPEDAADVAQDVFATVHRKIAQFQRRKAGDSFRKWLKTVTNNKARDHFRKAERRESARGGSTAYGQLQELPQLDARVADDASGQHEVGWLYHRATELLRGEFERTTWLAFWQTAVEGRAASDVAADLGVTRNAVYVAKSRVLSRLRAEFADVIDTASNRGEPHG